MAEKQNPFKAMMQARQAGSSQAEAVEDAAEVETQPKVKKQKPPNPQVATSSVTTEPEAVEPANPPSKRKRGRPATGKRSDPGWIGRTYYIKEETDIDVEMELALLRRQGMELDKSELVNSLLGAWVQWRQGENSEILLDEISPRRKDE